jgi:hypothetical protein
MRAAVYGQNCAAALLGTQFAKKPARVLDRISSWCVRTGTGQSR